MATLKRPALGGTLIDNLLIEKQDAHLSFPASVPLIEEGDKDNVIGVARLSKTTEGITANLELWNGRSYDRFFPAIGFRVTRQEWKNEERRVLDGQIYDLSLSVKPNVDSTIKCIADQLDK